MRGPSADVVITGRTGLVDQDYDQIVTVTPQISDNIPIASAFFGPVGIGVGAILYLAGELFKSVENNIFGSINKNIDKLLRKQYTITGTWVNPVIEKFSLKNNLVHDQQVSIQN